MYIVTPSDYFKYFKYSVILYLNKNKLKCNINTVSITIKMLIRW